jgi:hypothetical protein
MLIRNLYNQVVPEETQLLWCKKTLVLVRTCSTDVESLSIRILLCILFAPDSVSHLEGVIPGHAAFTPPDLIALYSCAARRLPSTSGCTKVPETAGGHTAFPRPRPHCVPPHQRICFDTLSNDRIFADDLPKGMDRAGTRRGCRKQSLYKKHR